MNTFRLVLLPPSARKPGDHATDGGVTAVKQPFKKHLGGRDALVGAAGRIRWPGYTQRLQRESQGFEERKRVCKTSPPGGAAHLRPCWGFPLNAGAAASLVSFKGGKEEAAPQLETPSDVNSLKM